MKSTQTFAACSLVCANPLAQLSPSGQAVFLSNSMSKPLPQIEPLIAHDLKRHALEIEESKAQLLANFDTEMLMTIANELDSFKDSARAHSLRVIAIRQRAALSKARGK